MRKIARRPPPNRIYLTADLKVVGRDHPGEVLEPGLVGELQRGGGVADLGDLEEEQRGVVEQGQDCISTIVQSL